MVYLLSLIPISAGIFTLVFKNRRRLVLAIALIAIAATGIVAFTFQGKNIEINIGNWSNLGITVGFDSLSWPFVLAAFIVVLSVVLNSINKGYDNLFYSLILLLYGSLNAVFISRDLFNVYVTVELAALICFILLAYGKKGSQIWASFKYMLVSSFGFNLYLLGIGLVYVKKGSFAFSALEGIYPLPIALIFAGLSVKSGLFLLSMWLPDAHSRAMTEVSPLLSGLMVKIEIYLIVRFIQYDSFLWLKDFYLVIGSISAIAGVIFAINANKAKSLLAYSTISQIGYMVVACNKATTWHAFSHAIFKSLLFIVAGNIYERLGTQDIKKWNGKITRVEYLALFIGSLAILGFPLTSGCVTKHSIIQSVPLLEKYVLLIVSVGTVISFSKFIFLSVNRKKVKTPWNYKISYLILIAVIFIHGTVGFKLEEVPESVIVIALGIVLYFLLKSKLKPLPRILERLDNSLLIYLGFIGIMLTFILLTP